MFSRDDVLIRVGADVKGLTGGMDTIQGKLAGMSQSLKKVGLGISAFGAAGTLAFTKFLSAAEAERIGIQQLDQALQNVGISYAAVNETLEASIEAVQRKTNFGDEAQRAALVQLISVTGSYEASVAALPAVLDLAAGKHMDLESASTLVARAISGETGAVSRYVGKLEEGATATDVLAAITAQFGGQAEAAASPLEQMKNRLGDLAELIGNAILPAVSQIATLVERFTRFVMGLNPNLLKWAAILGAVAVAFASVAGPVLLFLGFLPALIAGIGTLGTVMTLATGPIGLIALAIAGLVVAGIAIWRNWDTIKAKAIEVWGAITTFVKGQINELIGYINGMVRALNAAFNFKLPDWLGGKGFDLNIPEIPRLAHGGMMARTGLAVVGEQGPELALLPGGTRVLPNASSRSSLGGVDITIYGGNQSPEQIADAVAGRLGRLLADESRTM